MSKPSSHALQLFPFLAVLICAMGALILMLLVTTRRIKTVAVEKAIQQRIERAEALASAQSGMSEALEPAPVYVAPVVSIANRIDPAITERRAEELRAEWRSIVEELAREHSDQVRTLAAIRAAELLKDQERERERELTEAERRRLVVRRQQIEADREQMALDKTQLTTEQAALESALQKTKKAIQIKAEELASQPVPYTLMPYDGRLGTTRRPIIIECDDRSITFVCEGVTLTAADLSGFPSEFNPLLAGTRALFEYWSVKDRERATLSTPPPPYVLLVVRPQGTIAFYVARKLLERLDQPYGYELVTEDLELTWPQSDDQARTICRTAVDRVMNERQRIAAKLPGQRLPVPGELRYDNDRGAFFTEEVERLRRLDESVVVGGQRWRRDAGSATSHEPGAFQGGRPNGDASATPGSTRPSPSEHRDLPFASRTFQGSAGPRLAQSNSSGSEFGPSGSGQLRRFPELPETAVEPLVPQGTGPIQGSRRSGGTARSDQNSGSLADSGSPAERPHSMPPSPAIDAGESPAIRNGVPGSGGQGSSGDPFSDNFADSGTSRGPFSDNSGLAHGRMPTGNPGDETADGAGGEGSPHQGSNRPPGGRGNGGNRASDRAARGENPGGSGGPSSSGPTAGRGTPGAGGSGAAPEGMPVPRNLRSIGQPALPGDGKPVERRWGDREHDGIIALERSVQIHIQESAVVVADEPDISLRDGAGYQELKDRLAQTLDDHVSQWGRPPASFYWLPNVTFRIHPGGNQYYQALKALTDEWGMRSSVEFEFD